MEMRPSVGASPFLHVPRRRRVLGYVTNTFPVAEQDFAYAEVRHLADCLDADLRFAHPESADLGDGTGQHLRWLGQGLLTRILPESSAADLEHFRHQQPDRLDALLQRLARQLGVAPAKVAEMEVVQRAISQARWAQAWAPDLICSCYGDDMAIAGLAAAVLLGIPRVHYLHPISLDEGPTLQLLPESVGQADLIVAPNPWIAATARQRGGPEIAAKVLPIEDGAPWQRRLAVAADRLLACAPAASSRSDLGPRASFATAVTPKPAAASGQPLPFVILAHARTGSNLLAELLTSHPDVSCSGEIFNPNLIAEGRLGFEPAAGLDATLLERLRREDPAACFEHLRAHATQHHLRAFGCKLLYVQAIGDNRITDHLLGLPDLRVVHLSRRDRLARHVSQVRAAATDSWWAAAADTRPRRPNEPITIDARNAWADFEFAELLEHRMRATFAAHPVLEVVYEDLVEDFEAHGRRLLDFLQLRPQPLHGASRKTGERDPRDQVANWQALHDTFLGTRWSYLFHRGSTPTRPTVAPTPCAPSSLP